MKARLLFFLFLFFLIFSCQSSKKEKKDHQKILVDVYLRYLQPDKQLKAEISFSVLNSFKKKSPKKMEEVLLQQKAMDGKKIQNRYRYQLSEQTDFVSDYTLAYSSSLEKSNSQQFTIQAINNFSFKDQKISKSAGTYLNFEGNPLSATESLVLLFSDKEYKTSTIAIAGPSTGLRIPISAQQLAEINVGANTLYIVRKQRIEQELEKDQLIGVTEYYSEVKTIEVIE
jgi:hypothetical protein